MNISANRTHKDEETNIREWLDIIKHIPQEQQEQAKDFMRTYMVLPDRYADEEHKIIRYNFRRVVV